ncbi:MAG: UDP-glucose/GDP-mannose dehydrogenase family protein [Nitrospinae bacterium]|nr:UDP-glucose/GDP-mannose dehydrogenase family protein [Nitrospinota bacterium]
MNICVIGTGYVGLVTGVVFSDLGNEVVCVDSDKAKIAKLKRGIPTIYEPGLKEMLQSNIEDQRLSFTTNLSEGVNKSEIIFICVGTPQKNNGETNLSFVESAAREIAGNLREYKIIVNKSTVPVGTGDLVREIIEKNKKYQVDFDVVSNPEFLREGSAIKDCLTPDRIVIGVPNKKVANRFLELYSPLERPMLITDVNSAEIIKYASNSFLATKISFINAIADLCETAGANITDVAKGMGYDSRIGREFLNAGLGYGGSCFPKDVHSLVHTAKKFGLKFNLLENVIQINDQRVDFFVGRIEKRFKKLKDKTIGILGLAFKPDTDDLREAKSIEVIQKLLAKGARVKAYDPVAMESARKILPKVEFCKSSYDAAKGAHALIIITEWREFKLLNLERIKNEMACPVIFDGRNMYDPERKRRLGFEYYSIGRK